MNASPPSFARRPWPVLPATFRTGADPGVMLRQAGVEWVKLVTLWAAMAWLVLASGAGPTAMSLGLVVTIVLVAGRLVALGVILHDACHMAGAPGSTRPRGDGRLDVLALVAGYPIASTIEAMRFHHLRHHRHSCLDEDPYFKRGIDGPGRSIVRRFVAMAQGIVIVPFWNARAVVGTLIVATGGPAPLLRVYRRVFLQDRGAPSAASDREALACTRADPRQFVFLVAMLLATSHWPVALVLGYWVPVTLAGVLNAYRVVVEHVHVRRPDAGAASMLATTRSHRGTWSRVVAFPRNIGWHEAHHLYPSVPLALLPALDGWIAAHAGADASTGPPIDTASDANASQKRPASNPPPMPG